jgi:hypothetical protein
MEGALLCRLVALRKFVARMTKPVAELDREELSEFSVSAGGQPLDEIVERTRVRAVGEVKAVRIVPRAGAPALEVVITDGRGSLTAVFLGRRKIVGISPGRRLIVAGMVARDHNRMLVFNPVYELL